MPPRQSKGNPAGCQHPHRAPPAPLGAHAGSRQTHRSTQALGTLRHCCRLLGPSGTSGHPCKVAAPPRTHIGSAHTHGHINGLPAPPSSPEHPCGLPACFCTLEHPRLMPAPPGTSVHPHKLPALPYNPGHVQALPANPCTPESCQHAQAPLSTYTGCQLCFPEHPHRLSALHPEHPHRLPAPSGPRAPMRAASPSRTPGPGPAPRCRPTPRRPGRARSLGPRRHVTAGSADRDTRACARRAVKARGGARRSAAGHYSAAWRTRRWRGRGGGSRCPAWGKGEYG